MVWIHQWVVTLTTSVLLASYQLVDTKEDAMQMFRVTYRLPHGELVYVTAHTMEDAEAFITRNCGRWWTRVNMEMLSVPAAG